MILTAEVTSGIGPNEQQTKMKYEAPEGSG